MWLFATGGAALLLAALEELMIIAEAADIDCALVGAVPFPLPYPSRLERCTRQLCRCPRMSRLLNFGALRSVL
jgi:hypothetical protein